MKTQIVFLVDCNALSSPNSGTYTNPTPTNHPQMTVSHDGGPATTYSGDYVVRVPQNERIEIWLQDIHNRSSVILAPVRFLANTWSPSGDRPQPVTLDMVSGPDSPLQRPNFSVCHEDEYGFTYTGSETEWETTESPFTQYFDGVDAPRDVMTENPRVHHPYVTFNFNDYAGVLTYGVEFTVAVNGDSKGYWWFDPSLQVL